MNLQIPDVRILEIHPSPLSTLRSSCRTSSGFEERNVLGVPLLLDAIADASSLGYNLLHIAGEEPLLYPGLQAICREAHRRNMLTSLVVNRVTPSSDQLAWLPFSVDLLGVAIDTAMLRPGRGNRPPRVSRALRQRLDLVRRTGMPYAVVFTLTSENLSALEWAAEFAVAQCAAMLQIRPAVAMTDEQMSTAWMMTECLADLYRGRLVVHLDATNRYNLPIEPRDLASWLKDVEREARYIGEILSPLVIEHTGMVAPMRSGFPRSLTFGNLHDQRLSALAERWIETRAADFCAVYEAAVENARASDRTFGDLYEMVSAQAGAGVRALSAAGR
jgi:hypothetical protein